MTFYPGDKVIYTVSKHEYIVERCYYVIFNDIKLELIDIDIKPLTKHSGETNFFKEFNAKYFKLVS